MKDIILWKYERASWQWDVLCVLILVFIFATPKSWFDKREKLATRTSRLIVKAQDFPLEMNDRERHVREMSGNDNAEILAMSERKNDKGETFYEIDIR